MEKMILDNDKYYQNIIDNLLDYDVCINMSVNAPGDSKYSNEAKLLVAYFDKLINYDYVKKETYNTLKGIQINYFINGVKADDVKNEMVKLEDEHPLGRFIDLDVFEKNSKQSLSRDTLRKCYLCDKPAFVCQREENHRKIDLEIYFKREILNYLSELLQI